MKVTDNVTDKLIDKEEQWLDQLLEQPAVLADHGFTSALTARIKREEKFRKQIFIGAGVVWLIILVVTFPVQFLTKTLQQALTISTLLQEQTLSLTDLNLSAMMSQSGSITLLAIFLLGAYALISLQFRRF